MAELMSLIPVDDFSTGGCWWWLAGGGAVAMSLQLWQAPSWQGPLDQYLN